MDYVNEALRAIEAQQNEVKKYGPQWMVGEQLKDICRMEPACAELLVQDLSVKEMSITEAEKKIKAYADKHRTGNFACVPPIEAERILREFYGLPGKAEQRLDQKAPVPEVKPGRKKLDLSDFMA